MPASFGTSSALFPPRHLGILSTSRPRPCNCVSIPIAYHPPAQALSSSSIRFPLHMHVHIPQPKTCYIHSHPNGHCIPNILLPQYRLLSWQLRTYYWVGLGTRVLSRTRTLDDPRAPVSRKFGIVVSTSRPLRPSLPLCTSDQSS